MEIIIKWDGFMVQNPPLLREFRMGDNYDETCTE
jgi:hypothetical protein